MQVKLLHAYIAKICNKLPAHYLKGNIMGLYQFNITIVSTLLLLPNDSRLISSYFLHFTVKLAYIPRNKSRTFSPKFRFEKLADSVLNAESYSSWDNLM